MPVLIVLVLLPMQFALWWHGKQAADLAAEEGLDAAQAFGAAIAEDGRGGAYDVLAQAGNLTDVSVQVTATATTVTVEVRGQHSSLRPRAPISRARRCHRPRPTTAVGVAARTHYGMP